MLHDSDKPKLENGNGNPAWTGNTSILNGAIAAPNPAMVRVVASIPNFETAFLGVAAKDEKPYRAVAQLSTDDGAYARVRALFASLVDSAEPLPQGALAWTTLAELEAAIPA